MKKALTFLLVSALILLSACGNLHIGKTAIDSAKEVNAEHRHLYSESIKPATCTENSFAVYTCECGETHSYPYGEPLPHNLLQWEVTLAPKCEVPGERTRRCADCGYTETEELPPLTHTFGVWTVSVQPTAGADGKKTRVCTACGLVEEETMPATGSAGLEIKDGAVTEIGVCTDSEIFVPETYSGKSVSSIAERAFVNCASIQSVTLSKTVTSIGFRAFYNCRRLESITVPKSVSSVGAEAFSGCSNLKYVYFEGTQERYNALFKDAGVPKSVEVILK